MGGAYIFVGFRSDWGVEGREWLVSCEIRSRFISVKIPDSSSPSPVYFILEGFMFWWVEVRGG